MEYRKKKTEKEGRIKNMNKTKRKQKKRRKEITSEK